MKMIKRRKIFQSFFWFHSWPPNFFFFHFPYCSAQTWFNCQNSISSVYLYIWSCFLIISKNTSGKYFVLMALFSWEPLHVYKILSYKMSYLLSIMYIVLYCIVLFCYVVCLSFIWFKSARILRLNNCYHLLHIFMMIFLFEKPQNLRTTIDVWLFKFHIWRTGLHYFEHLHRKQIENSIIKKKTPKELTYFEQLVLS